MQQHLERNGEGNIELHKRKQFNSNERTVVAIYATYLMGWQPDLRKRAKARVALAACTLACYEMGFEKVVGKYSLEKWLNKMEASVRFNNMRQAMRRRKEGRTSYTDLITVEYPEYLHEMFCHATELLGNDVTFQELALVMNLQSAVVEDRPLLRLNKFNLLRWFKKNKGIEKRMVQRPILMNEHKIARLQHAELIQNLHHQGKTICYLDEKWFYCFSRRKNKNTYQGQHSRKME